MMDKPKQQNQVEPRQSVLTKSLGIGFASGIIWSFFGAIAYYFHFAEVSAASFLFRSYWQTSWTGTWLAELLAIVVVGIVSLGTALIYYMTFKRMNGIWPGLLFGTLLWVLVFWLLNPLFPAIPSFMELSSDTWVTTGCLFILYGVFIGYSISYEFREFNASAN
ncbi:hypothetical protein EQV77_02080 [Halobacillus fulvus]|nr:hypothetical protein EQV77_02080 [Halobacillus fulvus]